MTHFCTLYNFVIYIDQFSNIFHCQNQNKIVLLLYIPPHLKCVVTLPCEMLVT